MEVTRPIVMHQIAAIVLSLPIIYIIVFGLATSQPNPYGHCTLETSLTEDIKVHRCSDSVLAIRAWMKVYYPEKIGVNLDKKQTRNLKQCLHEADVRVLRKHDLQCEDTCNISESMYLRRCPFNVYQIRRVFGGKPSMYGINLDHEATLRLLEFLNKE